MSVLHAFGGNGLVTVDYYNDLDQLIKETRSASGTTTHTYDDAGNLTTRHQTWDGRTDRQLPPAHPATDTPRRSTTL